jgi:hypothetical protein
VQHTVQSGETLTIIAKLYGTTVGRVAADNGIADANRISVGQVLVICFSQAPVPEPKAPIPTATPTAMPVPSPTPAVDGGCSGGCTTHVPGCDIKGNIAYDSGEPIYHVPGQKYYAAATINPTYGERWFCTEAEAQAAGWRKAYR